MGISIGRIGIMRHFDMKTRLPHVHQRSSHRESSSPRQAVRAPGLRRLRLERLEDRRLLSIDLLPTSLEAVGPADSRIGLIGEVDGAGSIASGVTSDYVVHISVDGLRGGLLQDLVEDSPESFPTFRRLQAEGAFTYNARTDYTHTSTLPNHVSMLTGRPVLTPAGRPASTGHGWIWNSTPPPGVTLHNNNPEVDYIASVFDVVHDRGLSTSLFASKSKFSIFDTSYNGDYGAPDTNPIGGNNGRDKIDVTMIDGNTATLVDAFVAQMSETPIDYSFIHLVDPDVIGHTYGWESPMWIEAASKVDGLIGEILTLIDGNAALAGKTSVIVTADHGGSSWVHTDPAAIEHYKIPFFVLGPGIPAGADLYQLDPNHYDPADQRPDYNAALQPLRNGGSGNLALELLGLPPIPGSMIDTLRPDTGVDRTSPRIIESSLVAGSLVPPGRLVYEATFDEPLDASKLNASEIQLYSPSTGLRIPDTLAYDAERSVLSIGFENLVPDTYRLVLYSRQATSFADLAGNALDGETDFQTTLPSGDGVAGGDFFVDFEVRRPAVVARHLFYNDSSFDGNDPQPDDDDDPAIASDKTALLPGDTATFANYTSYDRGINGVMIDVVGLANAEKLNAADDFHFRMGNTEDPSDWPDAPDPSSVTVRPGAGVGGTDRVTILWEEHRIERQWLQVTVRATGNTGLARPDVFYFGNAPGEAGDQSTHTIVNATDEIAARNFQHGPLSPAAIVDHYDYNRDRQVNATDQIIARENQTNPITMLRLITAPQTSTGKDAFAAKVDWLFALEQPESSGNHSKRRGPNAEAVDRLLATYAM